MKQMLNKHIKQIEDEVVFDKGYMAAFIWIKKRI